MNDVSGICVRELTRRFGDTVAVDALSFDVHRGELFGIVGPDGAGKTTTLRMLAGVLRPSAGDASLAGVSVVANPEGVKQTIAYMSQRFGLYADLTVMENLDFYADLYRVPKAERAARVERLFEFSNLGPFKDRLAGKLSGGMKQKLGLSCALVHQPQILLLDEPTFGVDPISRRDLWLIVHDMVAQGVTVVVSTAYMDEAERFDRVALLYHGRLLALDTPTALSKALHGVVLVVELADARAAQRLLRDHPRVIRAVLFGDQLHVVVASAHEAPTIEAELRAANLPPHRIKAMPATMEDVFIERMSEAA
ncbi:MAG TPA: ABC transporter ATP-binding protein [Steroidobacteraceae bacterium]|nr:ABC transporter ATP-binding protein [Steroidobacteraceae bacterium]HRX88092.1 ABC transporter ATP-binding protein [Steroidobacteraceae bacterium]